MYKKFQQGGMTPPQPQMQQQGGLPPELQQILNSLPDDIKQYIMSLPIEQQIQELMKIAQGQVQAVQQSPNQMMQQGMNREQMRQPQGPPMMGRYGMKIKARAGINFKEPDINLGKLETSNDFKRAQSLINPYLQNNSKTTTASTVKPSAPVQPPTPVTQPTVNPAPNYNNIVRPKGDIIVNQPNFKEGDKMIIDGETVELKENNGILGYISRHGWKPLNIGKTTPTLPQNAINTGAYNFGNQNTNQNNVSGNKVIATPSAKTTIAPKSTTSIKTPIPSTTVQQSKPKIDNNSSANTNNINNLYKTKDGYKAAQHSLARGKVDIYRSAAEVKKAKANVSEYDKLLETHFNLERRKEEIENILQTYTNAPKSLTSKIGYQFDAAGLRRELNNIDTKLSKIEKDIDKKIYQTTTSYGRRSDSNYTAAHKQLNAAQENFRNANDAISSRIVTLGKAAASRKQQLYDNYIPLNLKKKTYAVGGPTDEDLREEYLIKNRQAQRNQRQENRIDRRIARRERLDQRRREGSVLDEFNEKRLGILQGRKAMKENQKFTNAEKRDIAAQQLQNQTQFAVAPPGNYQVQSPTKINSNNQVNNPPANTTTVPTTNPTTNNNQGSQRIATKSGKKGLSSFEQAFADARKAHGGPGGIFTWNGKQYTTDYKNEVGKGKSGQAQNPAQTPSQGQAQTPSQGQAQTPSQGQAQKLLNNPTLRQEAGEFGRGLMKVASYLDPGEWASHLAKKAGMDEKWANRLGTAVSVGSLFIPGLGIAGAVGKAGKLANMAAVTAKTLNAQKAARTALNTAKAAAKAAPASTRASIRAATTSQRAALNAANKAVNAEKMVTYGPKFGEAANRAQVAATNLAKKGIALAPGATQIGQGLDAYSEGRDKEALARVIGGTALGAVGARRIKNINKTAKAREAQSEYRKINGKDYVLNKNGQWTLVNPSNAATNTAEAEILRKAGAKTLIPVSNSPGTFMDSAGNLYNKAGQLISKAGSSVKSGASNLATKVKNLRKTSSASSAPPTSPAPPTTPTTPRYGGKLNYQIGGTISMPGIKSKDKFTMPIYGSKDNHYPKISPGLIKFFEQNPSKKGSIAPPLFDKDNPNPYENNEPYFKSPGTMAFFDEERKKYKKQNAPALEFVKYGGKMRIKTCKYGC